MVRLAVNAGTALSSDLRPAIVDERKGGVFDGPFKAPAHKIQEALYRGNKGLAQVNEETGC